MILCKFTRKEKNNKIKNFETINNLNTQKHIYLLIFEERVFQNKNDSIIIIIIFSCKIDYKKK